MIAQALIVAAVAAQQLVPAPKLDRAQGEVDGAQHAFVELRTPRAAYFEREVVPITLRVGVEAEFAQKNLLQLFVQPLDFPVQVRAPWLAQPERARRVREEDPVAPRGVDRFTIALNDEIAYATRAADEQRGGVAFVVLELEREYLPERAGELRVPAPSVRFACATKFEKDFFLDQQPLDWQLAHASGEALTLRIEPLPFENRPPSFTGAVGHFSARAETDAHAVDVHESFTVRLIVEGQGNTEFFDAPRLDRLDGIEVRGVLDDKRPARRTLTYDLAVWSPAVTGVPALEFAYFDPSEPPSYRVLRTDSIPLTLRREPLGPVGPGLEVRGAVRTLLAAMAIAAAAIIAALVFAWRKWRRLKRQPSRSP